MSTATKSKNPRPTKSKTGSPAAKPAKAAAAAKSAAAATGTATNAALLKRREAAVARGVASAAPVFAAHAENAELWDVEGNRYVDFAGGIAVLNTGHRHPKVMDAAKRLVRMLDGRIQADERR